MALVYTCRLGCASPEALPFAPPQWRLDRSLRISAGRQRAPGVGVKCVPLLGMFSVLARLRLGQLESALADLDRLSAVKNSNADLHALIQEAIDLRNEIHRRVRVPNGNDRPDHEPLDERLWGTV
jgi:hypothetical protein